ncbi:MAG: 3-hydroxyacyl-CoA dehydrogenase, partial [Proteobacteria bacterium]|nr:3-hydroxyacyl-CoA dehydrogenase [Burkholderiales bacterium]
MDYMIVDTGGSRSFPEAHALTGSASNDADVVVILGADSAAAYARLVGAERKAVVLIELGSECLGVHTGEARAEEGSNVLGFSRFRLGKAAPSDLVELVRQPRTTDAALEAGKAVFEAAGLKVAVCADFSGRIIDRLVRPYFNAALQRLDEGLASASDLDTTLKLGLGYPHGPIELLERTGLAHHYEATRALHEAYGDPAYAAAGS